MAEPLFSLVVATAQRTEPLVRLLSSLSSQDEVTIEIIIADQNRDGRLDSVMSRFPGLRMKRVFCGRGLSRARNAGMEYAGGQIIGFPDDDCWYPGKLLSSVRDILDREGVDGVTASIRDDCGRQIGPRWASQPVYVDRRNVWRTAASASMFLSRRTVAATGLFDERLGLGAESGCESAEETDYLLRALTLGSRILYVPHIHVHHPRFRLDAHRGLRYGRGMGRVLRRHGGSMGDLARHLIRPLGGCLLSAAAFRLERSAFYASTMWGRIAGFVAGDHAR